MFDRRPTANDQRFDAALDRIVRGIDPLAGAPGDDLNSEELDMARRLTTTFASWREAPAGARDRIRRQLETRIDERERAPRAIARWKTAGAVAALALLLIGAAGGGRLAWAAAEETLEDFGFVDAATGEPISPDLVTYEEIPNDMNVVDLSDLTPVVTEDGTIVYFVGFGDEP